MVGMEVSIDLTLVSPNPALCSRVSNGLEGCIRFSLGYLKLFDHPASKILTLSYLVKKLFNFFIYAACLFFTIDLLL
jgi:large-conductance mechanosensitive channel